MQQITCTHVCWSTSCNIRHPSKDLGSCYCDMHPPMEQLSSTHQQWFHIPLHMERERSVKAANAVPSGTTATPQALSSHCFLVAHPASPPPAPCMQPTPAAPAKLAPQMKQAAAVPAMSAVQKNALAPKSVTSHATPV